jgi:5S rRNA maturation endonuclease (ribonuclease M5)
MKFGAEVYLKLRSAIDELIERSDEGAIIIVEGVKDVKALRRLGVRGEIVTSANYSNAELVDLIGCREVIIMTDWDKKGTALERDLVIKFSSWGVVPNTELRKRIFSIIGREITSVEDLADFMLKLERELGIHWRF